MAHDACECPSPSQVVASGNWRQGPAVVEQAPVQGPQQPVGPTLPPHPLSNLAGSSSTTGCTNTADTSTTNQPSIIGTHSCKMEYINPDPVMRLIGPLNIAPVILEGKSVPALLDSGSQILSCTKALTKELHLEIHPLIGLNLHGVGHMDIPYLGYVEMHLQLPAPINWEGDILLLVLPHDDTPCILSTKVLQQVSREIPAECLQQSPPWKHALDAVCLADALSTELDQVSGPVVLSAKVKLAPGEFATLHGHLKLPEVLNKRVNVII